MAGHGYLWVLTAYEVVALAVLIGLLTASHPENVKPPDDDNHQ